MSRDDVLTQQPIFESSVMQQLLRMVDRVAKSKAAVLLIGETGSGKEVVAQTIHQRSLRADEPIIEVNCGAIPDHLVESELFGYEKGAFSGADHVKKGFFELADKGTLFLDEIGDLDLRLQSKLLRVLDGAPYFRLGGNQKLDIDVRIVAATNCDLKEAVAKGSFRRDLFHRLAQFQINVPPLRQRPEDVVALAQSWLRRERPNARFSTAALRVLTTYEWPGNVRELKNVVMRAAMLHESDYIDADDLEITIEAPVAATGVAMVSAGAAGESFKPGATLEAVERNAIFAALDDCGGHQGKAADKLGISRRTLVRKLKQYRSTSPVLVGYMSREQHQYFRAQLDTVVEIAHDGLTHASKLRNVSSTGLSVRELSSPVPEQASVTVQMQLPGEIEICVAARVVWIRANGEAGLAFAERTPQALTSWLLRQQAAEGWDVSQLESFQPVSSSL